MFNIAIYCPTMLWGLAAAWRRSLLNVPRGGSGVGKGKVYLLVDLIFYPTFHFKKKRKWRCFYRSKLSLQITEAEACKQSSGTCTAVQFHPHWYVFIPCSWPQHDVACFDWRVYSVVNNWVSICISWEDLIKTEKWKRGCVTVEQSSFCNFINHSSLLALQLHVNPEITFKHNKSKLRDKTNTEINFEKLLRLNSFQKNKNLSCNPFQSSSILPTPASFCICRFLL